MKDIIEDAETEKEKSFCLLSRYNNSAAKGTQKRYLTKHADQLVMVKAARIVGRKINPTTGKRDDYNSEIEHEQRIEINEDEQKTGTLTGVQKDNVIVELCHENKSGYKTIHTDKSCALRANASANYQTIKKEFTWRKLTVTECERLQTVPDNFTNHVSNSQRYKMLGNGWTVDVIAHIFRGLK